MPFNILSPYGWHFLGPFLLLNAPNVAFDVHIKLMVIAISDSVYLRVFMNFVRVSAGRFGLPIKS